MLGPKATYGHLFDVFQDAGYNNLADLVKRIATCEFLDLLYLCTCQLYAPPPPVRG